jgi:hypothetical protein
VRKSSQLRNDAVAFPQTYLADWRLQRVRCFLFCAPAAIFTFQTIRDAVLFGGICQGFIKINPLHECPKLADRRAVAVGTLNHLAPINRRYIHLSSVVLRTDCCTVLVLPGTKHTAGESWLQRSPDIGFRLASGTRAC